jgi:hypothetical protein
MPDSATSSTDARRASTEHSRRPFGRAPGDPRGPGATDAAPDADRPADRSTAQLIADLPRLVIELVQDELTALKKEIVARIARAGIGAGLIAAAAFVGFFALAVFVAAAIIALSLVVPGWAAALITVGGLLLIAAILAAVGIRTLKKKQEPGESGADAEGDR